MLNDSNKTPQKEKETVVPSTDSFHRWRYPMKIQIGNFEIKNEHESPEPSKHRK